MTNAPGLRAVRTLADATLRDGYHLQPIRGDRDG